MRKVFISYGDTGFKKSLKRIAKQARASRLFDKVEVYTPSDLPSPIRYSPLMIYHRGGGDSVMTTHHAIVFDYRSDVNYNGWEQYCKYPSNCKPALKHWLKPTAEEYFTRFLGTDDYLNFNHIMSGIIIIRKTAKIPCFIQQWLNIAVLNPSLFCDAYGEELGRLPETFNEHRHDQAILAPLVFHYKEHDNIAILPEKSESQKEVAAVIATRTHVRSWNLDSIISVHKKRVY